MEISFFVKLMSKFRVTIFFLVLISISYLLTNYALYYWCNLTSQDLVDNGLFKYVFLTNPLTISGTLVSTLIHGFTAHVLLNGIGVIIFFGIWETLYEEGRAELLMIIYMSALSCGLLYAVTYNLRDATFGFGLSNVLYAVSVILSYKLKCRFSYFLATVVILTLETIYLDKISVHIFGILSGYFILLFYQNGYKDFFKIEKDVYITALKNKDIRLKVRKNLVRFFFEHKIPSNNKDIVL